MSFPVTLAAGLVFLPAEAALVSFVGSFDPRELKGDVSIAKAIFNRSQVAASVMAGSALFHAMEGSVLEWPEVFAPGLLAVFLDAGVNAAFVAGAIAIQERLNPWAVTRRMFGQSPLHYAAGFLLLGLLALPLSAAVAVGGVWALLLFIASLVLAREMFRQTQHAAAASEAIRRKDEALRAATGEAVKERRDERLRLAGELHDEVLPSLFRVHLMGQVLRQDLARGRLLDLDEDLPELLAATEEAQRGIRDLLGDLRRSPIGAGGVQSTLRLLVDQIEEEGGLHVDLKVAAVDATALSQLLAYQVIREALHNATKHAAASHVTASLARDGGDLRLAVVDDGVGFDVDQVDAERHFGLQMMRERLEAAGGHLFIESTVGGGTALAARIPADL
jgi:signal transduction histidine kinase